MGSHRPGARDPGATGQPAYCTHPCTYCHIGHASYGPGKRVPRDSIKGAILSSSAIQESVLNEFDEEDKNDVINAIERFIQLQIEANVGLQLANLDKLIRDSTSYPSLSQLLQVIQSNSINTTNPLETLLNHRRLQIEDGSDTAVSTLCATVKTVREGPFTAESEVQKQLEQLKYSRTLAREIDSKLRTGAFHLQKSRM